MTLDVWGLVPRSGHTVDRYHWREMIYTPAAFTATPRVSISPAVQHGHRLFQLRTFLDHGGANQFHANAFSFVQAFRARASRNIVFGYSSAASLLNHRSTSGPICANPRWAMRLIPHSVKLAVRTPLSDRAILRHLLGMGISTRASSLPATGTAQYISVIAGQYFPAETEMAVAAIFIHRSGKTIDLAIGFATHVVTGNCHPRARRPTATCVEMGMFPPSGEYAQR